MIFCTNCGKQLEDDAKFCSGCGKSVGQSTSAEGKRKVEYKGTITNFGSIDAKLSTYTSSFNTDNEYVTKTITIGGENIVANGSHNVTSPDIALVKNNTTGSSTDVVVRYTLKDTVTELPAEAQTVTDSIVFGFVQK